MGVRQRRKGLPADEDFVEGHQLDHFQFAARLGGGGHNGEIYLAVFHGLDGLRRRVVRQSQPDTGVLRVERPQLLGQADVQRGLGGADADSAVFQRSAGAQFGLSVLDLHGGRRDAGVKGLPFRRQRHAPVGTDEQHAMQLVLEFVHGVGDVRLVIAQHPRRPGKVLIFGDIIKNFADYEGMIKEGEELAGLNPHIVVKVPCIEAGIKAIKYFSGKGIRTNCTLVFSPGQALLAAKAGATYVSPFVGRLDDIASDGIELVRKIVEMYDYYDYETQVLAASIRSTQHIIQCVEAGADVATCPLSAIKGLLKHPLTDSGLATFLADYKKVNG